MGLLEDLEGYITPIVFEATKRARLAMGLSPLADTAEDRMFLWRAGIAAAEDVKKAVDFVTKNAAKYNVDPDRIAMGGHSAGAGITLNVALAMDHRVAAIFPLSGPDIAFDHSFVATRPDLPPALLIYSQYDEHAQLEGLPSLLQLLRNSGTHLEFAWVPGFPHFYPHNAPSLGSDGSQLSVGDRVVQFLREQLKEGAHE